MINLFFQLYCCVVDGGADNERGCCHGILEGMGGMQVQHLFFQSMLKKGGCCQAIHEGMRGQRVVAVQRNHIIVVGHVIITVL